MKIAYIAHPIGAIPEKDMHPTFQVKSNLNKVAAIVQQINLTEPDVVPFAPYYLDCLVLDDTDPEQRRRGIDNDTALIKAGFITEIRLYGNRISRGMLAEIQLGESLGIPIKPMTPETEGAYAML